MSGWHRFVATSDDDLECAARDCQVVVSDEAMHGFTLPCPAPACTDGSNRDMPCVYVPTGEGAECAYCGRPGNGYDRDDGDDDDDPESC